MTAQNEWKHIKRELNKRLQNEIDMYTMHDTCYGLTQYNIWFYAA